MNISSQTLSSQNTYQNDFVVTALDTSKCAVTGSGLHLGILFCFLFSFKLFKVNLFNLKDDPIVPICSKLLLMIKKVCLHVFAYASDV
jgi:hypothetical protein